MFPLLKDGAVVKLCIPILTLCMVPSLSAQTMEEYIARGDSLYDALKPAEALEHYRAALPLGHPYELLWKFARAQTDIAKQLQGNEHRELRDSLYGVAQIYAEAAIRADSQGVDGPFELAKALGELSRTRGGRERVRFGRVIYDNAASVIARDPDHDGALHILGAWHAEIKRLSGLTRFFARSFLGANFMSIASWDSAAIYLERSVTSKPEYIFHRLELAEIYIDMERFGDAREQLELIARLAYNDVLDATHQERAAALLEEISGS